MTVLLNNNTKTMTGIRGSDSGFRVSIRLK
jgi:hypothetical protein